MLVIAVAVAGCGKQEPAAPTAPKAPSTAPAKPAMPSLQTGGGTATPTKGQAAAPTPAPPAVMDLATMKRPTNDKGDPMSDLEMLNHILANYNEGRATGAAASSQTRTYKTEAEQVAAEATQKQALGPVKDLSELVTAKVIRALPTPPAGKKFAIDPKTQKVVLVSAP